MRGLAPPSPDFTGWLRQVIAHRRQRSAEQVQADIAAGLAESVRLGTTLVGDISAGGGSWEVLANAPLRAVVFYELLGLPRPRAEQSWHAAEEWLQHALPLSTCRPGLSPHAPYSVSEWLFSQAARAARLRQLPLATHVAESVEELELLERQRGPMVAFLTELGVWEPEALCPHTPEWVNVIQDCEAAPHWLFVHANYAHLLLTEPSRTTVICCPRTHAAFGHPPHPFPEFLKRGVRVALGTDSLASNPDLDLLAEARFLHARYPDVPGATVLRMATLSGAEALGWADETGSLEPGKSADLVVLPLPNEERADPHELILQAALPVRLVLWRGQWRGPAPAVS